MSIRKASAAASVVVLLALGALVFRLSIAPMHGVRDVAECTRAYAKAKTRMDTMEVDFTSYRDTTPGRTRSRCYSTRAQPGSIAAH